ncbi:MAG: hypothetical protein ACYS0G_04175 [Planctomycetota bacterium]
MAGFFAALMLSGTALGQGIPACDDPDPGAGDCFTPTPDIPGCTDPGCCKAVCDPDLGDPFCCEVEWDDNCVTLALDLCGLANDDCANAIAVGLGETVGFDTTTATTDGETSIICLIAPGSSQIYNDIWYTFTPGQDNTYVVSLCGSGYDSMVAVYDGCDPGQCPPVAEPVACNDNLCGVQSALQFDGVTGLCYTIRVGGHTDGAGGPGAFTITTLPNDDCAGAIEVGVPSSTLGSTVAAGDDADAAPFCGTSVEPGTPGVWYWVTGTGNTITATTCAPGTAFDTKLSVYCNTCEEILCVDGNDDQDGPFDPACDVTGGGTNAGSTVSWCSESGTQYLILVHGFFGAFGDFELVVTDDGNACPDPPECGSGEPPSNDNCADGIAVGLGDTPYTTAGATTDGPGHAKCINPPFGDDQVNQDVWFVHSAGFTGSLLVTTCGLIDYDSRIAIYDTADCQDVNDTTLLGCNDDDPTDPCGQGPDFHSSLVVPVQTGRSYTIRVGGFGTETGSGLLRLEARAPHPDCPGAGGCFEPNGTPGCDDEQCCNTVCAFDPDCCDQAWDQTCADLAVEVCGTPVLCDQLEATCQLPDQAGHGANLLVAATSDANPEAAQAVADNLVAEATTEITEVCWWGIYVDFGPPATDCGPGGGDDFTITYFNNSPGSPDFPGTVRAGPLAVSPQKATTGLLIDSAIGPIVEFQFTATHDPVPVTEGETYWIQILNNTTGTCVWLWTTAPPGDGLSHQEAPIGSGYGPGTGRDYDLAWCLDIDTGPSCPWDCQATPDGVVGISDLLALLAQWGGPGACDFDGNGVGIGDLLDLLARWGICP